MRVLMLAGAAMSLALAIAPSADAKTHTDANGKVRAAATVRFDPIRNTETPTTVDVDGDVTAISGADVIVPGRARRAAAFQDEPISPLPARGVVGRGSISGGVGVNVATPPSANRQPSASF